MAKFMQLHPNGYLKMVDVTATLSYYDEEVIVTEPVGTSGSGYDSTHKIFTLPNSKTYVVGTDMLKVYKNGIKLTSDEYTETSSSTITLVEAVEPTSRISFVIVE